MCEDFSAEYVTESSFASSINVKKKNWIKLFLAIEAIRRFVTIIQTDSSLLVAGAIAFECDCGL